MKNTGIISLILVTAMLIGGCAPAATETSLTETEGTSAGVSVTETETSAPATEEPSETLPPRDFSGMTAEEIVAELTLEEKVNQMIQGVIYCFDQDEMLRNDYGSILSHENRLPQLDHNEWISRVRDYQATALASSAGIPYIYGQDSVHGINTCSDGVIFPHNINIGAANDPELTEEYGHITGSEMIATGMIWNFAPCVAVSGDPRWGRTYESYSSGVDRVTELSSAFTRGMLGEGVIVCPKHFFGDGDVVWGTGEGDFLIDRGDAQIGPERMAELLSVYQALIDEGAQTIMLSHSSLNGTKMHENAEYIDYLRNEMGFTGVILSDWDSIENCSGATLRENVINCVNAGIDMFMESNNYLEVRDYIIDGVSSGEISPDRIDEAVTRIIQMKIDCGIMEDPFIGSFTPSYEFGSDRSREVARTLVSESLVPIKAGDCLTIEPGMRVFVMGPAADDTGVLCGGWTYLWQGMTDEEYGEEFCPQATTILEGLQEAAGEIGFEIVTDMSEIASCDMIVLCIGEIPYAEWYGDTEDLSITGELALPGSEAAIAEAADTGIPTLALIVSGRNLIVDGYIDAWDSCVMCYLPGSEGGHGIADAITGQVSMTGTLPMPCYSSIEDLENGNIWLDVGYSALD